MLLDKIFGAWDKHATTLVVIWVLTGTLIALGWRNVEETVQEGRLREIAAAERDLANLTRLSQEHANRTLRSADQVIRFVQSRYLEIGNRLDLMDLTSRGVIDAEIFNQVGIIDANGIYALANLPIKSRLDLSDREHFRVHIERDTGELFVSKPVLGRASGKWSIQLTRRITRPNGEFAGVVVLSIDPGYFTRFYNELNLGNQGLAALYGLDGVARGRRVGLKEEFGTNAVTGQMFARMAKGEEFGSYTQKSVVDGVERLYHFRKVPHYQLAVTVGRDVQDLLANQLRSDQVLRQQAIFASLLMVLLAAAISRYLYQVRRDMLQRRASEMVIQDRTEQLNAIFALSPDGFVTFDRSRRVKYVNPAFIQMTSTNAVCLEGLDEREFSAWFLECSEPGSRPLDIADFRAKLQAGKAMGNDLVEVIGNGRRVLKMALRVSDSASVSQILYFRDVTHETEVDRMKSEFLSTAAHELRTPMASIFGFSELLLQGGLEAGVQAEFIDIVHRQSQLMAKILDELLDLARIEARRGKDFRYARVCVQDLLLDLRQSYIPPAGRQQPELAMPDAKIVVFADSGKLRQAVLNVLSNAYKYSPGGGLVRITVFLGSSDSGTERLGIRIEDQGIGMTLEQTQRVCDRFYRADTSGTTSGTGLGMSIVREIVSLHSGELTIESSIGSGSQITIYLPI